MIGSAGFTSVYHRDPVQRLEVLVNDLAGTANDMSLSLSYNPALVHTDNYVVRYFYKPEGQRHVAIRGVGSAGFVTTYHRDPVQRLEILVNDLPGTVNDMQVSLSYNPASQIRQYHRDNDAYAWKGPSAAASHDYTVNGQNQYTSAGAAALGYDRNGNLDSHGSTVYGYDVENRLVAARGEKLADLAYDPLGRPSPRWRARKASPASSTTATN